jgi:hypothetical protein
LEGVDVAIGVDAAWSLLLGSAAASESRPGVPRAEDNQITDEYPQSLTSFLV